MTALDSDPVLLGFLASLGAGLLTGLGAVPALFGTHISERLNDTILGFAAGVMLAASFFSLILPALDTARDLYGSNWTAAGIAVAGVLIGAATIAALNAILPHEHFEQGREGPLSPELARIWLFVIAITIHNLPEGMAVGVGFGGGDIKAGTLLATGIGLQNMPEGLAVALALLSVGYGRWKAFTIAALTGLVEPVTGLLGAMTVAIAHQTLPWAMTFAAGAMIYVISHEIIPETHRHGSQRQASLGLMVGLSVMMFLDAGFG